MKRTLVFLSLTCIIVLSACQAPAAPATATQSSSVPVITPTTPPSTSPNSPTQAAAQPATATPAGPCTDAASFVADVTIPDYSHFDQRATFTKTWRVKNVGTCAWTSDYKAAYARGDALGAPQSIALSATAPGATLDISANMAAPATDGKYQIFYQLTNASGTPMTIDAGDTLWALITVGKYIALAPPTAIPSTAATTVTTSGSAGGSATGAGLATVSCVYGTNATFVSQVLTLINAARAANSPPLPPLTANQSLGNAAQNHSQDMACNNYLSHTGWNGSTPDSRIAAAGYAASITRENIFAEPPQYGGNPQAAMDWWMGDQIHRDAILNAQVKEIGVGYATYSRSDLGGYFTVDFGAP